MINSIVALTGVLLTGSLQQYDISDYVQNNFKDASFTAKVVKGNQAELKKINGDFAYSYRFQTMKARLKEPFKLRMEANVEDTSLLYILNGTKKLYNVGNKIKATDDVSNAPGKRQTVFDFGILTPSLFNGSLFVAKFVRVDRESGDLVFDCTYPHPKYDDTSRHRIWVDKDKKIVSKRVWFSQEGRQLATFVYENPKQANGVWFPSRCTVMNVDNKVAGVTEYQNVAINTGLADSIFKT